MSERDTTDPAGSPEPALGYESAAPDRDGAFAAGGQQSAVTDRVPHPPDEPRRRINPRSPRQAIQPQTALPPPQRSRKAKHPLVVVLNFFLMTAVLAVLAAGSAVYFGKARFAAPGPLAEPKSVLISRGSDLDSISALLARQNVIDSPFIFSAAVRAYGQEDKLKAGEYLFEPAVSMEGVLEDLVTGKSVLHAVRIPEGLTSEQIVERLRQDPVLVGDIAAIPAEGSLMPDTYKFTRGATRQQILDQMERAQARAVDEIWGRRSPDLPIRTREEFVTLASIVEKETGQSDERSRVAGVFINRLRDNMRLQSDPTIIYGLFGGKGKPADRPIFRSDLEKETPYNTYRIAGLPPTPIANPGRAALEAVANPSRTREVYFVADGTGGHAFAETLEDHNRNVARWRKIEAAKKAAAESVAAGAAPASVASPAIAASTEPSAAQPPDAAPIGPVATEPAPLAPATADAAPVVRIPPPKPKTATP